MLAARTVGRPVVMLGTGFCCPPSYGPWPDLRPWSKRPQNHIAPIASRVLLNCNEVLRGHSAAMLRELPELFDVAETCLQTTSILDPYLRPTGTNYYGAWPHWGGKAPDWPPQAGPRIFAYLKSFPALAQCLAQLAEMRQPTIVVCDGVDQRLQKQFSRPWLQFENEPLDGRQATEQCDVAICNANHGTTLALLQAGKPALYLPLHLEQTLTGLAVQKARAGAVASSRRPEQFAARLLRIQSDRTCRESLRGIQGKLAGRDSNVQLQRIVRNIESVAGDVDR